MLYGILRFYLRINKTNEALITITTKETMISKLFEKCTPALSSINRVKNSTCGRLSSKCTSVMDSI